MSFFAKLKDSVGVEEFEEAAPPASQEPKPQDQPQGKKIAVQGKKKKTEEAEPSLQQETQEWFEPEGELAVDVYQTDEEIVIQSTIAGLDGEDLDVSIENDVVTIYGERKNPAGKDAEFLVQECYWGPFSRQVILPEEVDATKAEASMKEGIFTLRLPKFKAQKARKIKVRG